MTAIEFENISKQYRLGLVSTKTLSHDIRRFWITNVLGKEDPYLKIGETNDRSTKGSSEYVWALKDINFKVEQGDVLGIIGKNGAGKSTLLKLLSKVTGPTTGVIRAKGRIGSLLEVGTGFHQEMTGRENIYLNGAILGMTKHEISKKLDEIIDFSGCERYIDTPVKRYSSGMMVRLGFAVAAHLDPEILVVDEVLAVGDAEFQKKAIGKMQEVSSGEGRTVLFVSHNMASVRKLCKTGVVLKNGSVDFTGTADDAVEHYMTLDVFREEYFKDITEKMRNPNMLKYVYFERIAFASQKNKFASKEPIEMELDVCATRDVPEARINFTIFGLDDIPVGGVSNVQTFSIKAGEHKKIGLTIKNHNLAYGDYKMSFSTGIGNYTTGQKDYDIVCNILKFRIERTDVSQNENFVQWNPCWGRIMFDSETVVL
ncbi:MAG: ABC transporter ATP-binding protein [Bacteroidales bacterium]|nr:ABC transporter ATP-binding protein [Bacteroidales bacterium]